jgi:hypothetical protein
MRVYPGSDPFTDAFLLGSLRARKRGLLHHHVCAFSGGAHHGRPKVAHCRHSRCGRDTFMVCEDCIGLMKEAVELKAWVDHVDDE